MIFLITIKTIYKEPYIKTLNSNTENSKLYQTLTETI